jgi:hypothetical protein
MGLGEFFDNNFAKYFKRGRFEDDREQRDASNNSQGYSQEEIDFGRAQDSRNYDSMQGQVGGAQAGMSSINIQFEQYFVNKSQRIAKYREMSYFPEISDALDIICDDAICEDSSGRIVNLEIQKELPDHIHDEIRKHWEYLLVEVFGFNETAWDLFRKWLVEAELYCELVLNNEGNDIIDIKILPAHTMVPVYSNVGDIDTFVQTIKPINIENQNQYTATNEEDGNVVFDKDQVAYIKYNDIGTNQIDVRGFLESSIRTYNQLKNLEDAVVIYRLVRAPERRLWNINVGRMTKPKAEEYLRGMMQRYRKRIKYDSTTGAMDSAQNVQAMIEDYWFPKNQDGEGTTVDAIGGGQNLGEMEDVNYFLKKLYKNLKLPSSRWGDVEGGNIYSTGKSGEISREEVKFARFVERLQNRFKYLLLDSFITLLRLRGVDSKYVDYSLYNVIFTETNLFKEYKELELLESRFALLGSIESYIYKPGENPDGYFSKEFVLRKWFMMSDEEYNQNKDLLEKEKAAAPTPEGGEGFGDEGGEGFGGEGGGGFGGEGFGDVGGEEGGFGDEGEFGEEGGEDFGGEEAGDETFGAEESVKFNHVNGKGSTMKDI